MLELLDEDRQEPGAERAVDDAVITRHRHGHALADDDLAVPLRDATAADLPAITPLHDAEFPGTYATAGQLVAGAADGSRVVLVVPAPDGDERGVLGYAAGRVQPDGEGFVDFVAVRDDARGGGVGERLVTALTRELLAAGSTGRVALTVQEGRAAARRLYERLGFRVDESFVAHRSWG